MMIIVKHLFPIKVSSDTDARIIFHICLSAFVAVVQRCDKWCLLLSCLWSPPHTPCVPVLTQFGFHPSILLSFILARLHFFLFGLPKMLLCLSPGFDDFNLSLHSDMASVAKAMASPESGLEVRDRMWLKITIPNAFLGKTKQWRQVESTLVSWTLCGSQTFTGPALCSQN